MSTGWQRLRRQAAPQYLAALFLLIVGIAFHLDRLPFVLSSHIDVGDKWAAVVATVIFMYAYGSVTWPLVFGGLGQRRLIVRAVVYTAGNLFYCFYFGTQWFPIAFLAPPLLAAVMIRAHAVPAVGVYLALLGVAAAHAHQTPMEIVDLLVSTVFFAALVFAVMLLMTMLRDIYAGRETRAQVAVLEERLRVGRDLHDVVVASLTAIALKSEVADNQIDRTPDRAHRQVQEIADLSRRTMVQVRELVQGYRHTSLQEALDDVGSVLATAGIDFAYDVGCDDLPDATEQAFCWVARESVTNALRHAEPSRVRIELSRCPESCLMEVVNDGVLPPSGATSRVTGWPASESGWPWSVVG